MEEYPNSKIIFYDSIEELLAATESGKINFAVDSTYILDYVMNSNKYPYLERISITERQYRICIGVSKDANSMLLTTNRPV